jgi:hypothetical protein
MSDYIDQWINDFSVGKINRGKMTARVIETSGQTTVSDELVVVPETPQLYLDKHIQIARELPRIYRTPSLVANSVAVSVVGGDSLQRKIEHFNLHPKESIQEIYSLYAIVQDHLTLDPKDIIQRVVMDLDDAKRQDVHTQILRYLILGECKTRLGDKISRSEKNIEDIYFDVLLDVARIIFEDRWNNAHNLPWLADKKSKKSSIFRGWEKRAGDLGNYMGGAVGRAVSAGVTSIISPLIKLPDEVSRAIAFLFGITCRKEAETAMHLEILSNPDHFPEIPKEK